MTALRVTRVLSGASCFEIPIERKQCHARTERRDYASTIMVHVLHDPSGDFIDSYFTRYSFLIGLAAGNFSNGMRVYIGEHEYTVRDCTIDGFRFDGTRQHYFFNNRR